MAPKGYFGAFFSLFNEKVLYECVGERDWLATVSEEVEGDRAGGDKFIILFIV